ncbi:MAG: hypothetical protein ACPG5T_01270 [Endozoicomonas sp.]
MKVKTQKPEKGVRNRSFEFFSKEAEARGLVLLDAEEYKKMLARKEQLEEAAKKFQNLI